MPYPQRPLIPNPYQIAGQAAQEIGGEVKKFGEDQDALRDRFRLMMEKRAEAELKKQQLASDLDFKNKEETRKQTEFEGKEKNRKEKAYFLTSFQGADPTDPATNARLKQALVSGIIDAAEYKALQPKDPERFSAGGGYYEMGLDGKPRTIVAPKPDGGEKPTRGQVVTDANGNIIIVDPVTGQSRPVVGPTGTPVLGKGASSLPDIEAKANNSLSVLNQMVGAGTPGQPDYKPPHPGFTSAVGMKGGAQLFGLKDEPIAGSDAANFKALMNQVRGTAFLQAFESLKGGGQITEVEGNKATQAITRMSESQSEGEFIQAANELKQIIRSGLQRAKQARGQAQPPQGGGLDAAKKARLDELRRKRDSGTLQH